MSSASCASTPTRQVGLSEDAPPYVSDESEDESEGESEEGSADTSSDNADESEDESDGAPSVDADDDELLLDLGEGSLLVVL